MKICVYTIALNEIHHCDRWAASCVDADYRIVADTGSTDHTVEKLTALGVTVHTIRQDPWRFDHARNKALALCPADADICISLDMDEYLMPGWRQAVESAWQADTTRLAYRYVFDAASGSAGFWVNKIHARQGYTWRRPVHETVFCTTGSEREAVLHADLILQQQDNTKTTRSNYLPLMKIAHEEDPQDAQIAFWYARDMVSYVGGDQAAQAIREFLSISHAWDMERNEAYRLWAGICPDNAEKYLLHAIAENTSRLEPWIDLVKLYYGQQNWFNCAWACKQALDARKTGTYLDYIPNAQAQLYDYASIAYWNLGWSQRAQEAVKLACELNPGDSRIQNNYQVMHS
jgi:glycosyltransferase involved in cell wall biosynthesis